MLFLEVLNKSLLSCIEEILSISAQFEVVNLLILSRFDESSGGRAEMVLKFGLSATLIGIDSYSGIFLLIASLGEGIFLRLESSLNDYLFENSD